MVSLKDIAKRCNVSIASVSKALNNHSDISEEVRERIQKTAKEMGYLPNAHARALKTSKTYNIGVLLSDESGSGLTHPYFAGILESFKKEVEKSGYDVTFVNMSREEGSMTYLEHCKYRRFDGIIIACIDFNDAAVKELLESDIPIITIDYEFDGKSSVSSDNINGMADLVRYIAGKGHKRIAYICGDNNVVTKHRLAAYYRVMEELNLPVPENYVKQSAYRSMELTRRKTEEILNERPRPTCIMFPDDYSCICSMNVIREKGLRIPEDISVAGYDGMLLAKQISPQITTLQQETQQIGEAAAKKLISTIEKPKTSTVERITVRGTVIYGSSVAQL